MSRWLPTSRNPPPSSLPRLAARPHLSLTKPTGPSLPLLYRGTQTPHRGRTEERIGEKKIVEQKPMSGSQAQQPRTRAGRTSVGRRPSSGEDVGWRIPGRERKKWEGRRAGWDPSTSRRTRTAVPSSASQWRKPPVKKRRGSPSMACLLNIAKDVAHLQRAHLHNTDICSTDTCAPPSELHLRSSPCCVARTKLPTTAELGPQGIGPHLRKSGA
jgi:hypothetical protein